MQWLSKLIGTAQSYFRIGFSGPRLKNSSGALHVRDSGDSAFANVEGATLKANDADVILDADGNALTISRNSSQSGALQVIWPAAKGTDGHQLRQKSGTGAGIIELELAAPTSNGLLVDTTTINYDDSSPVTAFTLPSGATIEKVRVTVDTAFDDASATITVGLSGDAAKYAGTTDTDLDQAAETVFDVANGQSPPGGTEDLEVTISPASATAGVVRVDVYYSSPA